ncbi:unconventional myosin-Va-like isoform X1 [Bradysia coprophila]|uniref:unconventional myosin-Va-like isoform X1 n=1 Tax=Bradysia coprophila TaxID=38358 RepID=UPI00187DA8B8|nr:unconventional myosin-Va-like isoform X1 [Bradysia coprophila]
MSSTKLYTKDARIWIQATDPSLVWEGAVLTAPYTPESKVIHLVTDAGVSKTIPIKNEDTDLPPLRNPAILIGQNDLTALSYLHEPDVLHNLEVRFCGRQAIYTYCGIILVAINPYAELPLYGPDMIRAYRGHAMGELEPHIFAVAEEAYAKLEREKCDLSIIVSGESGAGKTVSAKYAMRYFAAVGGSESETQIEKKVLASSPIMEAIGNAKTTRNDNSSRFGKFTKLLFTNYLNVMSLTGATMQTYLLEKSRVVFQAPGERNYHIFYQLCSARDQWPELMLDHQDKFRFLNQGNSPDIARVSDLDQFSETIGALNTLGFTQGEVNDIVKVLASILHLGNIEFFLSNRKNSKESDNDGCSVNADDLHLNLFSDILKLNVDDLQKWLIHKQIESMNETVLIPINLSTSEAARDALAKHIYAKLFQYIVNVINKSLVSGKKQNCFIGVLDIYGFETFETNSFEQFCINYANEKLQQQFNQHVFKLEQEEYLKEGIVWTMIDFYDNQPCIDLIESKLGILDLLDEECRMPKGSDESWVGKLIEKCSKYKHFDKPRFGTNSFFVKHFSDTVEYDAFSFLEKNRDTVSKELVNCLRESEMDFLRKLMELDDCDDGKQNKLNTSLSGRVVISASKSLNTTPGRNRSMPSRQHRQSVGSQFRESLSMLIQTLHATTPHYVRCIKPNEEKKAFKWEPTKIVQQLRACGVLETVRISAAGFPSRWQYDDFYARYRLLCKSSQITEYDFKETSTQIINNWIHDDDKYRFGNTQIFFRAGQVAFLEQVRLDVRKKYIIVVQSMVRRFVYRHRYNRLRKSVLGIQRYARGYMARRKADQLRKNRAAVTIQRYVRGWVARNKFVQARKSVLGIQKYGRGLLARRKFTANLDNYKATQIQRLCRGYLARVAYKSKLRKIIICQSAVRRFLAKRLYKKMKAEARTISHMQKMYKGLENKIISMQQRIDELNKENVQLKTKNSEIPELKTKLEGMKNMENELKASRIESVKKDEALVAMRQQLENERDEKMNILEDRAVAEQEWDSQKQTWRVENEELKKQVHEMIEFAKKEEKVTTSQKSRLLSEVDNNEIHQAYQHAIKDKENLESDNYILRNEIDRLVRLIPKGNITHSRSISNASSINIDEDFGYSSSRNTLEVKRPGHSTPPTHADSSKGESFLTPETFAAKINSSTPTKSSDTVLILKLRKLLDDERLKRKSLEKQISRIDNKSNKSMTNEESLKASELEVENEKLRQDYQLLRNSINRGVESQELEAQYVALQDENKRRRDECIQLRAILAQQSQSLRTLGSAGIKNETGMNEGEIVEAFQAQKLVNRQLESELSALTEENNLRLTELNKTIDDLRSDRDKLQEIIYEKVIHTDDTSVEVLQQSVSYLRYELEKALTLYSEQQEQIDELTRKVEDLINKNNILSNRLREHGLDDSTKLKENVKSNLAVVKKKAQVYRGIFKYNEKDTDKILQRLIVELTPRVAITLFPGLPAYIVFMTIRYTDLLNTDKDVRLLLTNFLLNVRKVYRSPNTSEYRVLWLVNTLKLHNLLKQYGGVDEYMLLNTDSQNQQQLKNFDLSEYRQVILGDITGLHEKTVRQVQEVMKPHIVPAILDHDEMARGKSQGARGRSMSLMTPDGNQTVEPKSLVNQLEYFYKQFQFFGLDDGYIEQIFKQLLYYICAISINNLMLRQELCMWKTGMKIRYNVSCLEDWARKKKMPNDILQPLQPLIQVSSLLQSRKSEEDVDTIFELCSDLTTAQVLRIIKSYTLDDCENPIQPIFIEKLEKKLNERNTHTPNDLFTMEENFVHPLKVIYKYDSIKLEEIELPTILNLDDLLIKI